MKPLTVIGLNSGTSLDGIDAAAFRITPIKQLENSHQAPNLKIEMLGSLLYPFESTFRYQLQKLMAAGESSLDNLSRLNFALGEIFASSCQQLMRQLSLSRNNVDLIGSHGQTIWHAPNAKNLWGITTASTMQLGEPSVIAARTGIKVVADFRTQDIAHGGQGAPLVAFADEVLFANSPKPLMVLNIGGIANFTILDRQGQSVMAFDTGPGNMIIDRAVQLLYQKDYDHQGQIAASGKVDRAWLSKLLLHPYFQAAPPKTTGRELFGFSFTQDLLHHAPKSLDKSDIIATLTALTAASIAQSYEQFVKPKWTINTGVLGGGGEANQTLRKMLSEFWPHPISLKAHEDFGISSKFKEALLFALLAYTTYFGIPNNSPSCTGANKRVCLGKLCQP